MNCEGLGSLGGSWEDPRRSWEAWEDPGRLLGVSWEGPGFWKVLGGFWEAWQGAGRVLGSLGGSWEGPGRFLRGSWVGRVLVLGGLGVTIN